MTLSLIHEEQALERFALKSNTFCFDSWQYERHLQGRNLVLFDGDLELTRSLSLDWSEWNQANVLMTLADDAGSFDHESFANTIGLIVNGNLTVDGPVINASGDGGPLLLVMGDLTARHLIGGGAEIQVKGNANIDEVIWGHYNDGVLVVNGDANAPVVINDDHHLEIRGARNTEWEFDSDKDERDWDDENAPLSDNLNTILNSYVSTWDGLEWEVWSGNYVLSRHSDRQAERGYDEWLAAVSENGRRLISVPAGLKDDAMCDAALQSTEDAISYVPSELLSDDLCRRVIAKNTRLLSKLPSESITRELCELAVTQDCDFFNIPEQFIDDNLLKDFLLHNGSEVIFVVSELGVERLTPDLAAAAIMGGATHQLPEQAINDETAYCVLEYGVEALEKLPGVFMTDKVYDKTKELFASQPGWSQIEESHRPSKQISEKSFLRTWQIFMDEESCLAFLEKGAKLAAIQKRLRTKKVCDLALENDTDNLEWVPVEHLSAKLCLSAVKDYGLLLQHIPDQLQTEDIILEAVLDEGEALQYVSADKRSAAICIAALMDDEDAHIYVPNELKEQVFSKAIEHFVDHDDSSEEFWLLRRSEVKLENGDHQGAIEDADKVLRGYPDAEGYLIRAKAQQALGNKEHSDLDALAAIAVDEDLLDDDELSSDDRIWLNTISESLVETLDQKKWEKEIGERPILLRFLPSDIDSSGIINRAVQKHPGVIEYVPKEVMTSDLWLIAFLQDVVEFDDIPKDKLSEKHCLAHVDEWGSNLRDIPDDFKTEKVCRKALKTSSSAMEYVPFELMDKLEQAHLDSGSGSELSAGRMVMRVLYEGLFVKPTINLPAEKGLIKYFGERPMVASLTMGLASLFVMILHLIITVDVWRESGWIAGSLTLIGFWIAECYWAWKEYESAGITSTFIMCLLIVIIWPPLQLFFGRVNKLVKTAFGR